MDPKAVAEVLGEIGTLLEILGENPFKVRAYQNAARTFEGLQGDLARLVATGELKKVQGIGEGLAEKITTLATTGRLPYLEELRGKVPAGILAMLAIPGLGPKRARALHDKLGLHSIEALAAACAAHKVADLPGFGEKTEQKILEGIEFLKRHQSKFLYPAARKEGDRIVDALRDVAGIRRLEIAGSLRRRKEIIGDVDILAAAKDAPAVMKRFAGLDGIESVIAHGETKSSVRLRNGLQVDLRCVTEKEFPFALNYFTGSKEHNTMLRTRAKKLGLKLNEYALARDDGKSVACKSEEDIYETLKLDYVAPELREGMGEIEAAEEHRLPALVEEKDIRGAFHVHTQYSDGANTLEEMVEAARKLGWEYVGLSDHSQSATYAHGMKPDDVRRQHREIDALNAKMKDFRIFKGCESDIKAEGTLDFPDDVLDSFDFIIGSVHDHFTLPEEEQTARVLKVMEDPHTTFLGHSTGRLLLQREGFRIDLHRVLDGAAKHGVVVETNAHPLRLDLDWRYGRYAREKGVLTSVNPDSHNADGLRDVQYGVGIARKGWATKADVVTTMPVKEMEAFLQKRKSGRPGKGTRRRKSPC